MLEIRTKVGVAVDLGAALQRFVDSNYPEAEAAAVSGKIKELQSLREQVLNSVRKVDITMMDVSLLEEYSAMLGRVTSRFPFGVVAVDEGWFSSTVSTVKCQFTYFESFRPKKKASEYDDKFELLCTRYNLGALYAHMAITEKKGENGLKEACRLFQMSAGVFESLTSDASAFSALSPDLSADCLAMTSALMLAQAQACFVEQACKLKASADLVAKLAAGAASLFTKAHRIATSSDTAGPMLAKGATYAWATHCHHQYLCFQASSYYWRATSALQAEQHGLEVGLLSRCKVYLDEARGIAHALITPCTTARQALERVSKERLRLATKDNETIYFASVPKPNEIPAIDAKVVVKSTPYVVKPITTGEDPFVKLIPAKVHADAKLFREQAEALVHANRRRNVATTQDLRAALNQLHLPGALDALDSTQQGLPPDLWVAIQEIQFKGGVQALNEQQDRVMASCGAAQQLFHKIQLGLDTEAAEDMEMRQKFGHRFTRRPSPQITADLLKQINNNGQYFKAAEEADVKIFQELRAMLPGYGVLGRSQAELEAVLPKAQSDSSLSQAPVVVNLNRLMQQLIGMEIEREGKVEAMGEAAARLDVCPLLLDKASQHKTREQIFTESLQPLREMEGQLATSCHKQTLLLAEITATHGEFMRSRASDPVLEARERMLQNLRTQAASWTSLMDQMHEGLNFYNTLRTSKLEPLNRNVADFVCARNLEKTAILSQLTEDFASMGAGPPGPTGAAAGPPIPMAAAANAANNPNNFYALPTNPAYGLPQGAAPSQEYKAQPLTPTPEPTPQPTAAGQAPYQSYQPYHQPASTHPIPHHYQQPPQQPHTYQQPYPPAAAPTQPMTAPYQPYQHQQPQSAMPPAQAHQMAVLAAPGPSGTTTPEQAVKIQNLVAMGFDQGAVRAALEGVDWDETRATNHLLNY